MLASNSSAAKKKIATQRPSSFSFTVLALIFFSCLATRIVSAKDRSPENLQKLNQSVDALIKRVSPSVVQILVTGYGPLEEGDRGNTNSIIGRQRAIGSGFVIEESGYIVSNAHVVSGAEHVQVVLPNPNVE